MGKGRPRKSGQRKPSGRLRQRAPAIDYGNERVVDLRWRFRPFQGGKGDQWCATPIGRAWLVGLLDGYDVDPAAIRDAGLDYAERYWGYWPAPSSVANYEGQDRRGSSSSVGPDLRGERFLGIDVAIRAAGRGSYDAVQSLVIDQHWFPEENPLWLDRLINARLIMAGRPVAGELPRAGDEDRLKQAVEGLLTIVAGTNRRGEAFGRSEAA